MKEAIKLSAEANRASIEPYLKERFIYEVLPYQERNTIDKLYNDALSTIDLYHFKDGSEVIVSKRNFLTNSELVQYLREEYPLEKDKIISLLREAISCNNEAVKYWNVVEFEESDEALVDFYYYAHARIIAAERFDSEHKKTAQAIYALLITEDVESIEVYGLPGYDPRIAERLKLTQEELLQLCKDLLFSLPPGSYTAGLTMLTGVLRVNAHEWNEALFRQDITGDKKKSCKAPNKETISIEFSRRIK